jgi:hypothetical protein
MRTVFPQISKIDLYVGGELLSPVDDKRLIGKCHFPERVVRLSLLCKLVEISTNSNARLVWQLSLRRLVQLSPFDGCERVNQ